MSGDTQGEKGSCRVVKRVEIEDKAALREGDGWYMRGRCRERRENTRRKGRLRYIIKVQVLNRFLLVRNSLN